MAGYSATPLQKKLGIKESFAMFVLNPPVEYFNWIAPLPQKVNVKKRLSTELDFIHVFVKTQSEFKKSFTESKKALKDAGMLWISWPKK